MRQASPAEYLAAAGVARADGLRVGLAPHSVRACPRDWLEELGRYAAAERAAAAHPRLRAAARDRGVSRGARLPPDRAARPRRLPRPHVTVVHATHADGTELDLLAESGATVCACPTTEADLADGFLPAARIDHRRIPLSIGSDSNVRIDPFEELRELEGIARRQTGRRGVFSTERLLCFGADEGGALARTRVLAGDRDRRRARLAPRRRARRPPRRTRVELLGGRRQRRMRRCTQKAVRSR